MPAALNSVQTRQQFEELFGTKLPLSSPATFVSPIRQVNGFDSIGFLGVSDVAFSIQIEEACAIDGEFVVTQTLSSAVTPNGFQAICERIQPCGSYMRVTVVPGGAQSLLSFCSYGVPAP